MLLVKYPLNWLKGESLGEKIACELRLKIINGTMGRGSIISENAVASEFGTSRSPVREALKILANEGLIKQERMGNVVLGLTDIDIEELYDVRFLIESFTLERINKSGHSQIVPKLEKIIHKMVFANEHQDYTDLAYQDLMFHETIILEANHLRMTRMWNSIRDILLTLLLVTTEKRFRERNHEIEALIENHKLIVEALISGSESKIKNVIKQHFDDTRSNVNALLE